MPTSTIAIMNSSNVMAPLQQGTFFEGSWQNIRVIAVSRDEDSPESVRKGLVGLVIPTIFTTAQIKRALGNGLNLPEGMRFSYIPDIAEVLVSAQKSEEAEALRKSYPNQFDLYGFEREIYELVE